MGQQVEEKYLGRSQCVRVAESEKSSMMLVGDSRTRLTQRLTLRDVSSRSSSFAALAMAIATRA